MRIENHPFTVKLRNRGWCRVPFCLWSRIAASLCAFAVLSVVSPSLAQVTTTYSYDRQGQVTTVTRPANTVTYGYDTAGNRIALNVVYPAPGATAASLSVPFGGSASLALPVSGQVTGAAVDAAPTKGAVSISGTTATYTASGSNYGADSFTYHAVGPGGNSPVQTISVTIANPPAPGANNGTLNVGYNSAASQAASTTGVATGLVIDSNPAKGSVTTSGTTFTYTATWPNYGADSFTYHATGPGGASPTRTMSVNIANGAAPVANNGSASTAYNAAVTLTYPVGGDYAVAALDSQPAHGGVSAPTYVNGVGSQSTYTPQAGYYGTDSWTFHGTSPFGNSPVRTFSVTVGNPPAPTVAAVSASTAYNTAKAITLSPSGVYNSLAVAAAPLHGSASISGTTATYTPTSGYYGSDSFTYNATGPGGTSAAASVSVTVANPPAPAANDTGLSVAYNSSASSNLSVSGVVTGLVIDGNPSKGTVSVSGATATYTATWPNYGADSFTYHAIGPGGSSPVRTVAVTIGNGAPPTASDGAITTGFNTPITFTYPKAGDYAVAVLDSSPAHGSVSAPTWVSGVGYQSVYTPTTGYSGADAFTFHASSPFGASPVRTISVTVGPPPAPTVAAASINSTYNGSGAVVLPVSGVYTSIGFPGGSPAHGVLNLSGATVTYYPTSGYYGADSFTYNATGPGGTSGAATVSVTVGNPPAPTASAVSASTAYNTAKAVTLAPSGVYTSLAVAGGPSHGSASISGTTATYTPTSGYSGSDSFAYTATGPGGTSAPATVSVTVGAPPPNNPPTAVNDGPVQIIAGDTVNVNVTANDSDPDGDTLTVIGLSKTTSAKANYSFSGGIITVTAKSSKGADSLTYTVSDGKGGTATATLSIFVNF